MPVSALLVGIQYCSQVRTNETRLLVISAGINTSVTCHAIKVIQIMTLFNAAQTNPFI